MLPLNAHISPAGGLIGLLSSLKSIPLVLATLFLAVKSQIKLHFRLTYISSNSRQESPQSTNMVEELPAYGSKSFPAPSLEATA